MTDRFTNKAKDALSLAVDAAESLGHPLVGTEHILIGLIQEGTGVAARVLENHGVSEERVFQLIQQFMTQNAAVGIADPEGYTPKARRVLENSYKEALHTRSPLIGTEHILVAILKEPDCGAIRLLNTLNVDIRKMYLDLYVSSGQDAASVREEMKNSAPKGSNKNSSTPTLDQYGRDLTAMAKEGKLDPVIGRETEITRVIQILSRRTKNNPCLIGEPGVGKTAIAEGLAARIVEGNIPETISGKRLVTLDLSGMVAGSKYRGEFEERIKTVINEVRNDGGVLLFIDELHTIIGAGGAEGAMDASNILKPALARGEIQIIGATTIQEY
ncbi:MAG: Clp protease N-terminal domain-containing protein, partial [Lachnospiraceae bacterium]|nr:Clp protease N-terminal domain-containing protein [Lachnospiraceae bacterium]